MSEELTIYHHNGMCMIVEMRHVEVLGREVKLTKNLFDIFETFMKHPGQLYSRGTILSLLNDERCTSERRVDTMIKKLRRALFPDNFALSKKVIVMEYGEGYKLAKLRKGRQ